MASKRGSVTGKRRDFSTVIEEGTAMEGKFAFSGTVLLNGNLDGEIASNDIIIVGEKATITASIRAGFVQVSGQVTGDITGAECVELCAGSRVRGDIEAPVVIIEDGAIYEGHCRMTGARAADVAPRVQDSSVMPLKRIEPPR